MSDTKYHTHTKIRGGGGAKLYARCKSIKDSTVVPYVTVPSWKDNERSHTEICFAFIFWSCCLCDFYSLTYYQYNLHRGTSYSYFPLLQLMDHTYRSILVIDLSSVTSLTKFIMLKRTVSLLVYKPVVCKRKIGSDDFTWAFILLQLQRRKGLQTVFISDARSFIQKSKKNGTRMKSCPHYAQNERKIKIYILKIYQYKKESEK